MGSRVLISTVTVGAGGAASIDFTSIPSIYTHLSIKTSMRWDSSSDGFSYVRFNSDSGNNYSYMAIYGDTQASSAGGLSSNGTNKLISGGSQWDGWTAGIFGNIDMYIPNYTSSIYKSFSGEGVGENNSSQTYPVISSGLWSNASAITSISLFQATGNWLQYSTASLYGLTSS